MKFVYLDSCAAIKLFKAEPESDALRRWLARQGTARQVTSHLARTEVRRGLHAAHAGPQALQRAEHWLHRCAHVALTEDTFDRAGRLSPGTMLRSLDALHLAAAISLGAALECLVSYDLRLVKAAEEHGLPTAMPG